MCTRRSTARSEEWKNHPLMPDSQRLERQAPNRWLTVEDSPLTGTSLIPAVSHANSDGPSFRFIQTTGTETTVVGSSSTSSRADDRVRRQLALLVNEIADLSDDRMIGEVLGNPDWTLARLVASPEARRTVIDLHHIVQRLLETKSRNSAFDWLRSFNASLGARPIDVLRQRGSAPVIEAIDVSDVGSYR